MVWGKGGEGNIGGMSWMRLCATRGCLVGAAEKMADALLPILGELAAIIIIMKLREGNSVEGANHDPCRATASLAA